MKFILTGPKCSGKSKLGYVLADYLSLPFYETDLMIEELFKSKNNSTLSCRAICSQYGEDFFRKLEQEVVEEVSGFDNCVISTGGSTMLNRDSRQLLRINSILILITASLEILLKRLSEKEIPSFLNNTTAKDLFSIKASMVTEVIKPYADIIIDSSTLSFDETLNILAKEILSFMMYASFAPKEKIKFLGKECINCFVFGISPDGQKNFDPSFIESLLEKQFALSAKVTSEHPYLITVCLKKPILSTEILDIFKELLPIDKNNADAIYVLMIQKAISAVLSGNKNTPDTLNNLLNTPLDALKFLINS